MALLCLRISNKKTGHTDAEAQKVPESLSWLESKGISRGADKFLS